MGLSDGYGNIYLPFEIYSKFILQQTVFLDLKQKYSIRRITAEQCIQMENRR